MDTTEKAETPDILLGYPSKGKKIWPAWVELWAALRSATGPLDGRLIAEQVAELHHLAPGTLVAMLSRAAKAGLLAKEIRSVEISVRRTGKDGEPYNSPATRGRTFYWIPEGK